jgi:hypothetical protein
MSTANKPRSLLRIEYEEAAEAYLRTLPPEHFMEATAQSTQRKITLAAFDVIHVARPDIQLFSELLVQYPHGRPSRIHQVVPDNFAVVWNQPIVASGSYDLPLQPTGLMCVMEYVSKHSKRKDYDDNFQRYERDLKVPYYLLFYPDNQEMTLYRRGSRRYISVKPNGNDRLAVAELEVEVGLLDGWVRYWFRGQLVPLTGELHQDLLQTRRALENERRRADDANRRADDFERRLEAVEKELARLRDQPPQISS